MNSKPISLLVFDISGEYGHFRKYNTTSSPLTYTIPTRVAVAGMLGAILGIEREVAPGKYPEGVTPVQDLFSKVQCDIGIQLVTPSQKTVLGFNMLMTKKSPKSFYEIQGRTQVAHELVKHPRYRVFVSHQDNTLQEDLADRLRHRRHHFTPYLGLSQFAGSFEYVDTIEARLQENDAGQVCHIATAINMNQFKDHRKIILEPDGHYATETMPVAMTADRVVTEYAEVLIETNAATIQVAPASWVDAMGYGNILFL